MPDHTGYNGNPQLKRTNVVMEYTREELNEFIKCSEDVNYFISNYCKIITEDGLRIMQPYDFQTRMIDAFSEKRFVVCLLPRQMGKTTIVAGYLLHYGMFNSAKTIAILANKGSQAREIMQRVQRMYENLPSFLQIGVKEWNKGSFQLENETTFIAGSTSSDAIRGLTAQLIYLDEFAFVRQQLEFWQSTYPVVSAGKKSKVLITSTPNKMELFYSIYTKAVEGQNEFYPLRVHWSEHPDRDKEWERVQRSNIGDRQFAQEFECEFLGSVNTLISTEKLQALVPKDPINYINGISQYEQPEEGKSYVLVADVAEGRGLDYSAFSVLDISQMPYRQVCTFRDNMIGPIDYASVVYQTSRIYNEAYVLVEINSIGGQVAETLFMDYGCETMLFTQNAGRSGKKISGGFGRNVDKGIKTTASVKSLGCSTLQMMIEQDQLLLQDQATISELSTFVKTRASYAAETGAHDDTIMPLVLFSWLTAQPYFKDLTDINTLDNLRAKTQQQLEDEMMPLGFVDTGHGLPSLDEPSGW